MDTKGLDTRVFGDIEEKENEVEVAVEADGCETYIHATTQKDINALLVNDYEVYGD